MQVEISAPARLHLGDLDPFALGRFGYAPILAIKEPRTVIDAEDAEALEVNGLEAAEARTYAKRVLEAFNLTGATVTVKAVAPRNSGFGSTTQLCLAVGRAVTNFLNEMRMPLVNKALTEIQVTVGRIYQPVQEQIFNPASQWLIPILNRSGALGIGQSSWGPTVYAFTDSPEAAQNIAEKIEAEAQEKAEVTLVGADNSGARLEVF